MNYCDRCGGVMNLGWDEWGEYWHCQICGVYADQGEAQIPTPAVWQQNYLPGSDWKFSISFGRVARHKGCA